MATLENNTTVPGKADNIGPLSRGTTPRSWWPSHHSTPFRDALKRRPETAHAGTNSTAEYLPYLEGPTDTDLKASVSQVLGNKAPVHLGKYYEIGVPPDGQVTPPERPERTGKRGRKRNRRRRLMAQKLLDDSARIQSCGRRRITAQFGVLAIEGQHGAYYGNVQSCGSVWACPACADKIAATRKAELRQLEHYAATHGLVLRLVTYTAPHAATDDVGYTLDRMKRALRRFRNSKPWRRLRSRMEDFVTNTEVMYGRNGAHVHFHELWLFSEAPASDQDKALSRAWSRACLASDLEAPDPKHGLDIRQVDSEVVDYLAKSTWSISHEVAGAGKASKHSVTPFQLLDLAEEGDSAAAALYRRHVEVFSGRRALSWSKGLKARVGIAEVSDQDAAEVEPEFTDRLVMEIEPSDWRLVLSHDLDVELLETIEEEGERGGIAFLERLRVLSRLNGAWNAWPPHTPDLDRRRWIYARRPPTRRDRSLTVH